MEAQARCKETSMRLRALRNREFPLLSMAHWAMHMRVEVVLELLAACTRSTKSVHGGAWRACTAPACLPCAVPCAFFWSGATQRPQQLPVCWVAEAKARTTPAVGMGNSAAATCMQGKGDAQGRVAQRARGTLNESDALHLVIAKVVCLARNIAPDRAHAAQLHRCQPSERPRHGRPAGALLLHRQQPNVHAARQGDAHYQFSRVSPFTQAPAAPIATPQAPCTGPCGRPPPAWLLFLPQHKPTLKEISRCDGHIQQRGPRTQLRGHQQLDWSLCYRPCSLPNSVQMIKCCTQPRRPCALRGKSDRHTRASDVGHSNMLQKLS